MKPIFIHDQYTQFKAPNADELISTLNEEVPNDDSEFHWGNTCQLERIKLDIDKYRPLILPSVQKFAEDLKIDIDVDFDRPWLNIYRRRDFQEIHHHRPYDVVCVFFLEDQQKDFAKFYFFNKYQSEADYSIWRINGNHFPKVEAGDIIMFPAHVLHGVTPHKSDIPRRTFAVNFSARFI